MKYAARQSGTTWGMGSDREKHWSARGACRDEDPERMWPLPEAYLAIANARRVCDRCPLEVRLACLQDGVDTADWDSVRGGLTGRERMALHRAGYAPVDYPQAAPEVRMCERCSGVFTFDPAHPRRRLCEGCDQRRAPRAPRTHCRNQHAMTPDNVRIDADGSRRCRQCDRNNSSAGKRRRRMVVSHA